MSPRSARSVRTPLAWRIAGSVVLLLAIVVVVSSASDIEDIAQFGFDLVLASAMAVFGGGLLAGRVWAYWPTAGTLALLAIFLGEQAIGEGQLGTAVAAGLVLATLVGLLLPPSWRARVRAGRREDREAWKTGWMMSSRERMLLRLSSAAFASLGALMFLTGGREDRPAGVGLALFGFAGLMVFWAAKPSDRAAPPPETGNLIHKGSVRAALVFRLHRGRGLAMSLGAAAFAGFCALLAIYAPVFSDSGESPVLIRVVGTFGAVFFGLAALAWGWSSSRGFVALLGEGILVRSTLGTAFVPWDTVKQVGLIDYWGQAMFGIDVSDPSDVEMPGWGRVLNSINRRLTGRDFTFPVGAYGVPPAVLEQTTTHYLEHPEARARIGSELPPGLAETREDS